MTRLVKPLVYILGCSVVCACTTTKRIPQDDLTPTDDERNLVVILVDGARLQLRAATIDSEDVRGWIAQEDSLAFSRYVVSAGPGERHDQVTVVVPRSDVADVQRESPSRVLSMALGFFAVVAFVGVMFFKGGDCSGLC